MQSYYSVVLTNPASVGPSVRARASVRLRGCRARRLRGGSERKNARAFPVASLPHLAVVYPSLPQRLSCSFVPLSLSLWRPLSLYLSPFTVSPSAQRSSQPIRCLSRANRVPLCSPLTLSPSARLPYRNGGKVLVGRRAHVSAKAASFRC